MVLPSTKSSEVIGSTNFTFHVFISTYLLCYISSLKKGISAINLLDDSRFEQFLRRIISKIKLQNSDIFNEEEVDKLVTIFQVEKESLLLAIKTLVYFFKRLLKFILMPIHLKNDFQVMGLNNEKADLIVKLWASETKTTLDELGSDSIEKLNDSLDFTWCLNAELSSDYCKKTKVPKAYLSLSKERKNTEMELTHSKLYSMFLQFEAIQNELDNLEI